MPAPALRRGVARNRRVSVEDGEMRHGRKSRSMLRWETERMQGRDAGANGYAARLAGRSGC